MRGLWIVCLLAVLGFAAARPTFGRNTNGIGKGGNEHFPLLKLACAITNSTSLEVISERPCPGDVSCDVVDLKVPGCDDITLSFCASGHEAELVERACSITTLDGSLGINKGCRRNQECSLGPLNFDFAGMVAQAFFCQPANENVDGCLLFQNGFDVSEESSLEIDESEESDESVESVESREDSMEMTTTAANSVRRRRSAENSASTGEESEESMESVESDEDSMEMTTQSTQGERRKRTLRGLRNLLRGQAKGQMNRRTMRSEESVESEESMENEDSGESEESGEKNFEESQEDGATTEGMSLEVTEQTPFEP